MTKSYLRKFIKYAKKVYHIEEELKALTDGRKEVFNGNQYRLLKA